MRHAASSATPTPVTIRRFSREPTARSRPCDASGTVLGVFPEAEYAGAATALHSGDRLLLYTDGITEARNADGEEFGEERLSAALARHRHLDAKELHGAVAEDVKRFATAGFEDDATLMAVAVR